MMMAILYRPQKKEINVDEVFEKELVGEGTYGQVFRAVRKDG